MSSVNQQNIDVGNDDYDKLIRAQTIGRMTQWANEYVQTSLKVSFTEADFFTLSIYHVDLTHSITAMYTLLEISEVIWSCLMLMHLEMGSQTSTVRPI